jgi:hypothetical protein
MVYPSPFICVLCLRAVRGPPAERDGFFFSISRPSVAGLLQSILATFFPEKVFEGESRPGAPPFSAPFAERVGSVRPDLSVEPEKSVANGGLRSRAVKRSKKTLPCAGGAIRV